MDTQLLERLNSGGPMWGEYQAVGRHPNFGLDHFTETLKACLEGTDNTETSILAFEMLAWLPVFAAVIVIEWLHLPALYSLSWSACCSVS